MVLNSERRKAAEGSVGGVNDGLGALGGIVFANVFKVVANHVDRDFSFHSEDERSAYK